jgi:hypothetical protein
MTQNFPIDIGPILKDYGATGVLIFTNAILRNTFTNHTVHYMLRDLQQAVFITMKYGLCQQISGLSPALPRLSCHLTPAARMLVNAV